MMGQSPFTTTEMNHRFIIILIVLLGLILWTAWRFWRILPFPGWGKWLFVVLYLLAFLVIFPHFIYGNRMPLALATATYEIGTSWMIFFLYALIIFTILSIGRLLHIVPATLLKDSWDGTITVFSALVLLLTCGYFNYHHKYRESIEIETEKPLDKPLTIVLASDLHAGYHNRKAELSRWVELFNAENPDLVLFAGDIIDGSIRPVKECGYAEVFRKINAPVYSCLGNHEYISGKDGAEDFFREAGIRLLKDSVATECGIRIIGRDDRSNPRRSSLGALAGSDSLFTILLDHQPYDLEEAQEAGIDFQFSGHTHHGQVWPGNWITDAMYEKAFGEYRRGSTRYYVSSGLGIWGGKFRIGTRSEYLVLSIR